MHIVTARETDTAADRERCREIFRSALGKYRALQQRSLVKVQNPERWTLSGGEGLDPVLWARDFLLACYAVLHGAQLTMFELYYLQREDRRRVMDAMNLRSRDSWQEWRDLLEEKAGGELEHRRIWPVSAYIDRSEEIQKLFAVECRNRFRNGRISRVENMDGDDDWKGHL